MTTLFWIIAGLIAWLLLGVIVGILTCRSIRGRGHHYPSPNHPTMRAHKHLTNGRPLDPYETAAWKQCEEKLR